VLSAGVVDSVGLAFGWTVFLLAVTERDGYAAATAQYAAGLVGVAVSGLVSARLARRLSPRDLLRVLAVAEGICRVGVFGLFWLNAPAAVLAALVAVMNVLAWSAFAAMRTEMSRAQDEGAAGGGGVRGGVRGGDGGAGRLLTLYAVAILSSEALATGLASVVLSAAPPTPVLAVVATVYGLALVPQWLVATGAPRDRPPAARRTPWRVVALPCGLGGVVFLLAGAPALAATVLAYDLYGRDGVLVSAVAFAAGAMGASRVQGVVGRWQPPATPAFALGALLVGGWAVSGAGLVGLALAQACAGVAQCALEGDLDARTVARSGPATATSALALASSSRALGGALAVYLLPVVADDVSMALLCSLAAGALAVAAVVSLVARGGRRTAPAPGGAVGVAGVPAARRPPPAETGGQARAVTVVPRARR
jgi:hypothetical protein